LLSRLCCHAQQIIPAVKNIETGLDFAERDIAGVIVNDEGRSLSDSFIFQRKRLR